MPKRRWYRLWYCRDGFRSSYVIKSYLSPLSLDVSMFLFLFYVSKNYNYFAHLMVDLWEIFRSLACKSEIYVATANSVSFVIISLKICKYSQVRICNADMLLFYVPTGYVEFYCVEVLNADWCGDTPYAGNLLSFRVKSTCISFTYYL